MTVEGMADDIAILNGARGGLDRFAVNMDRTVFYGIFLSVSVRACPRYIHLPENIRSIPPADLETHL